MIQTPQTGPTRFRKSMREGIPQFHETDAFVIGVISDTHGLLRAEALTALGQSSLIIHAGDIGNLEVLDGLRAIAPVVAVRGNIDRGPWAETIRHTETMTLGQCSVLVVHNIKEHDVERVIRNVRVVISGHSHKPSIQTRDGVLFINPGSAGPRRFKLPVAVARLHVHGTHLTPELVDLTP